MVINDEAASCLGASLLNRVESHGRRARRMNSRRRRSGSAGSTASIGPAASSAALPLRFDGHAVCSRRAKQSVEEALFSWIVSDFGLNDADIESGLVKTSRVGKVRDDSRMYDADYRSRLLPHLQRSRSQQDDLNRKAEPQEPLPGPGDVNGYYLLGQGLALETAANEAGSAAAGFARRYRP